MPHTPPEQEDGDGNGDGDEVGYNEGATARCSTGSHTCLRGIAPNNFHTFTTLSRYGNKFLKRPTQLKDRKKKRGQEKATIAN